jgi:hypothetical protein
VGWDREGQKGGGRDLGEERRGEERGGEELSFNYERMSGMSSSYFWL